MCEKIIFFFIFFVIIIFICPIKYAFALILLLLSSVFCKSNTLNFSDLKLYDAGGVDGDLTDMARGKSTDNVESKMGKVWDNSQEVNNLFAPQTRQDGDEQLGNKMKDVSENSKTAMTARARYTSDNFKKYFDEELNEQSQRPWWEDDSLDFEMHKDGEYYN